MRRSDSDNSAAPADAASTREKLLEAAARLFLERGYAATGVSAVLAEAGVRSGSMYYFFKSKDDLLVGVLDRYLELLRPVLIEPVEAATADPIDRVFTLLAFYRHFLVSTNCRLGCPIGNLALEISDTHEEARQKVVQNFENWCAVVAGWLVDAGERLPASCDRGALSRYVLTVMEGGQMQAKAQKRIEPYDASIAGLRDHFNRLEAEARAEKERNG
ncbi:MAG: TetR family transcriptional regulator [Phycisphaerales bacterium]|nr:TetR family transcriptional regulator [Phycisphaerales bacterium]